MNVASLVMLAVVAAPAMVSAGLLTCDVRLDNLAIEGARVIKKEHQPDPHWCMKACMMLDGCDAYSMDITPPREKRECVMFDINKDTYLVESKNVRSWVSCDAAQCDEMKTKTLVKGGEDVMPPFTIQDAWWCRKKCMETAGCNAMTYKTSTKKCWLRNIKPGQLQLVSNSKFTSYVFCDDYGVLPVCDEGEVLKDGMCVRDCGSKGAPLCYDEPQCEAGLSSNHEGVCDCGNMWQMCCDGQCGDGMTCDMNGGGYGQCTPCGGDAENVYQTACPGNKCNQDDMRRVVLSDGQCGPCGGQWQPMCDSEPKCDGMMMPDMHGGNQCVMAGLD